MARTLGKYQLLKSIATGGMAEIFVAKQLGIEGFEKLVVIKLLRPEMARNQAAVDLFLNEARLAARLAHPNVVQIFDLGAAAGEYYIAMEYVHGENLSALVRTMKKHKKLLSLEQALNIVCAVLEGLHHAHTQTDQMGQPLDIVHCDVSPHNIQLSYQGVVKLVDFGIARVANRLGKTNADLVAGKLTYMSPEQAQGLALDARTDLFSLGIVLWELAAGQRLYGKRSPAQILELLSKHDIPTPRKVNPLCPAELEPIVLRAVARDPERRFQSAYEMHAAVVGFMKSKGMIQNTMALSHTMQELFRHKLDSVKRIEQAQQRGAGLEALLFDDLGPGDATTDPGLADKTGDSDLDAAAGDAPTDASAPISISEWRFSTNLPTTGVSPPRPAPRRFPFKALGLVLVLAAAGLALWHFRGPLLEWGRGLFAADENAGQAAGGATVRLETVPSGAAVERVGGRRCTAPCVFSDLALGREHVFRATMPGRVAETLKWTARRADRVEVLTMKLARAGPRGFGRVVVVTEPRGARVELDGKPVSGRTPLTIDRVSAGRKHRLRAQMDGRLDWQTTFALKPGQELMLDGELESVLGPGKALLTLESTPRATVRIDGRASGRTPIRGLLIDAGTHMIELVHPPTNSTESLIINAAEGEKLNERVTFARGKLIARSTPEADVIIGGKRIGTTPLEHELVAGSYQVTFANFAKKLRRTKEVVIQPEQTTRVQVDLDAAGDQ